jgi:FdhD protein
MNKQDHKEFTFPFEVIRVSRNEVIKTSMQIAGEVPYTIVGNGHEISTLMCSSSDLKELTFGFLFNSGYINSEADILSYDLNEETCMINVSLKDHEAINNYQHSLVARAKDKIKYTYATKIGFIPIDIDFRIEKEKINGAMKWFQKKSVIFQATDGVHSSALSIDGETPGKIFEDVARHNAVDKVAGNALIQKVDFSRSLLFCSCRISTEIIQKACRCKIPFVVSLHSPTHQAILLAKRMNITLIGNLKISSFIIYTCPERVIL